MSLPPGYLIVSPQASQGKHSPWCFKSFS